jgi:hypothetical protein
LNKNVINKTLPKAQNNKKSLSLYFLNVLFTCPELPLMSLSQRFSVSLLMPVAPILPNYLYLCPWNRRKRQGGSKEEKIKNHKCLG